MDKKDDFNALGRVVKAIAHDLRSPLQILDQLGFSVESASGLLKAHPEWAQQDPKAARTLKLLQSFEQRFPQIIRETNHYLDMTLMKFSQKPAALRPLNIQDALDFYRSTYPFRNFSEDDKEANKVHIEVKENFVFKGDPDAFYQVLANLTQNALVALKTASKGEIFITASSGENNDPFNTLSFKDTGIGMSPEVLKNCFQAFYSTAPYGIGMGLPLCRKIMESFGGSIECESVQGETTTFTLRFPKV